MGVPNETIRALLRCPRCRGELREEADGKSLVCAAGECDAGPFPVADGVPVLIDDSRSLYSAEKAAAPDEAPPVGLLRRWAARLLPKPACSGAVWRADGPLLSRLAGTKEPPLVLVIGCGEGDEIIRRLRQENRARLILSDVRRTAGTDLVADAHDLPLADGCVDGVIGQFVLEHVSRPERVVEEIRRVLRDGGWVYSEAPFVQPLHDFPCDFRRWTPAGHRRLFRGFRPEACGIAQGPGYALYWQMIVFARSLFRFRALAALAVLTVSLLFFWLRYLDRFLRDRPAALVGAAGTFFLGTKTDEEAPSEREELAAVSRELDP